MADFRFVQDRARSRAGFAWAFGPLALLYLAGMIAPSPFAAHYWQFQDVVLFFAPLGLTYSLLNRRLLDIGFVLNRAAVFPGVSVVIVGIFVLVEWLISGWTQQESHSTNLGLSGALALGLGLSIHFVHAKVEHFVDYVP